MNTSQIMNVLFAAAFVFVAMIFITPFMEPYGTFIHLDGTAGVMDHWNMWTSVNPVSGAIYALGDVLCHQVQTRSLMINGSQMAFCIRDVGFMIGLTTGIGIFRFVFKDLVKKRDAWFIGIALVVPMIIEWSIEYSTNMDIPSLRMITGILAGVGISIIIHRFVSDMAEPEWS